MYPPTKNNKILSFIIKSFHNRSFSLIYFEIVNMTGANGSNGSSGETKIGTTVVKKGLAQMLKGGVIVSAIHQSILIIN